MPGIFVEMVFHPGAARKHAVPPKWSRTRPGALLPATSSESDPRHGPETERVSFVNKLEADTALTVVAGPLTLADFKPTAAARQDHCGFLQLVCLVFVFVKVLSCRIMFNLNPVVTVSCFSHALI